MRSILRQLAGPAAIGACCLALPATGAAQTPEAAVCSKIAAPSGSDRATGTEADPYRGLEELVESLEPGDTGCLRAGTYGGDSVYFETPRAELRSYPGELATITAFMEVKPSATGARISHLRFDASHHSNNTGIKLQADHTTFSDNELTKGGRGICLLAGTYHPARGIVIERNHIYDCGPSSSKFMHQIYLQGTRDATVRWNILSGNGGGWGVHLYTDADGSTIEHNVIDGNRGGVIFAGTGGSTSDGNIVRNNAITNSGPRWNIEGSWSGEAPGRGNRAHDNCVYSTGEDAPTGIGYEHGFTAGGNVALERSPYVNAERGDYRFDAGNPCGRLVGDVAGAVAGAASSAPRPPAGPAAERQGPRLSLRVSHRRVRPARALRLSGRLAAPRAVGALVLQIRQGGRWRSFGRTRVRADGTFSARIRTARAPRPRVSRMRVLVPGVTRSRTIRLLVAP